MKKTIIDKELFKEQIEKGSTIKDLMSHWNCSRTVITDRKREWGLVGLSPNSKPRDNGDGSKTCKACMTSKPISEFYSNGYSPRGVKKLKPNCKSCENSISYKRRYNKVFDILDEQNRLYECELCGYNKNSAGLCFHHKTPEKNFQLTSVELNRPIEEIRHEVSICAILCHNCHAELHNPQCEL